MVGVCLGAAGYCLKACYHTVFSPFFWQKSGIKGVFLKCTLPRMNAQDILDSCLVNGLIDICYKITSTYTSAVQSSFLKKNLSVLNLGCERNTETVTAHLNRTDFLLFDSRLCVCKYGCVCLCCYFPLSFILFGLKLRLVKIFYVVVQYMFKAA